MWSAHLRPMLTLIENNLQDKQRAARWLDFVRNAHRQRFLARLDAALAQRELDFQPARKLARSGAPTVVRPPLRFEPAQARRKYLPKHARELLMEWLMAHKDHPYPTAEEKEELARQCGITQEQVSNWFINARARALKR